MKKKLVALFLIGLLIFGASACGKNSSDANSVKTITVGVTNDAMPVTYVDEKGEITGYEVDIMKAVDELLPQYEFQYEATDQTAMLAGLQTDKYQLGTAGLMATSDREETFLKVDEPLSYYYVILAVRQDSTINSLADCVGKTLTPIAPNNGLYSVLVDWESNNQKLNYDLVDIYGYTDGFQAVMDGTYDAYLTNADAFNIFSGLMDGWDLKMSDPVATVGAYAFTNKEETDLNKAVTEAIKELKENGTLTQLSEKWYDGEDVTARTAN
ncbi:MAG: transporter substrate-binding domain-containing protein [Anaerofustis sp.]